MINKRGQLFGLYIVALTLLFCGVSVAISFVQQGRDSSLVSPRDVLVVSDDLGVFEMLEQNLIRGAFLDANGSGLEFGSVSFNEKFRSSFLDGINSNAFMKEFLFKNLTFEGRNVRDDEKLSFLNNIIYPEGQMIYDGSNLLVGRERIEKSSILRAENTGNIHFPIVFTFEFERKYSVDKNGVVTKL